MSARAADPSRSQPLQSAVQWALLGLVIERPSYGYELATRFERAYGEALRLSSVSYAYTALQGLEQRGLIEEVARSEGRQPKPIYRATREGVEAFQEQLACEVSEERRRSRVSARKLAVFAGEPELGLRVIVRIREACLKEAVRSWPGGGVAEAELDSAGQLAARLAAEESRLAIDAKLAWLDYAARELRALLDRQAPR